MVGANGGKTQIQRNLNHGQGKRRRIAKKDGNAQ